jgi:hypothetical protein
VTLEVGLIASIPSSWLHDFGVVALLPAYLRKTRFQPSLLTGGQLGIVGRREPLPGTPYLLHVRAFERPHGPGYEPLYVRAVVWQYLLALADVFSWYVAVDQRELWEDMVEQGPQGPPALPQWLIPADWDAGRDGPAIRIRHIKAGLY